VACPSRRTGIFLLSIDCQACWKVSLRTELTAALKVVCHSHLLAITVCSSQPPAGWKFPGRHLHACLDVIGSMGVTVRQELEINARLTIWINSRNFMVSIGCD